MFVGAAVWRSMTGGGLNSRSEMVGVGTRILWGKGRRKMKARKKLEKICK
jgi:hypothetical protein